MLQYIHHLTINVSDLTRAIARYRAYGLVCQRHTSHDAWMVAPNGAIHLQVPLHPTAYPRTIVDPGISHCCIQTPDIDALLAGTHHTDAVPRSQPVDLGTGHRYVYLDDADDVVTECEGVPYAPPTTPPWLAHVALASDDIERLAAFYAAVTGGTIRTSPLLADNQGIDTIAQVRGIRAHAAWVRGANLTIECWQFTAPLPQQLPARRSTDLGYSGITFCTPDIEAAVAHLFACGARSDDATTWYDPDGNRFDLITEHSPLVQTLGPPAEQHIVQRIEALWHR
jgi:catechol 2,3-dioxygenase-like lactoylglutathione lyase family enzyme